MIHFSQAFPKRNRILKREAFKEAYRAGQKFQARYFTAFVLPNSVGEPRMGITTSRKIGSSVGRNRARRLVREVFRKSKWFMPQSIDIVINVKKPLVEAEYHDLEADFLSFVKRMGN